MSDFQKEVSKVAADTTAVLQVIKIVAYPLVFIAGLIVGLMF